ncbi:MAG: DinB family protein [Blastocatellia bacterium AA13]|nr:MAG: DinB family protein [Blastocatellia bacterium AA13]
MSTAVELRPSSNEYAPYYDKYVTRVGAGDIVAILHEQLEITLELLRSIPESKADFRYAEGKWSIKEIVGHITDAERVFSHRAFRFGRGDKTPLPTFDHDSYVVEGKFELLSLSELANEFEEVRRATISLLSHFSAETWNRIGTASDAEVSVRALAYITAGHELHHVDILRERYLS